VIYLGIDWAEAHHDICLLDEGGRALGKARVAEGLEGLRRIHELVAEHTDDAGTVLVGIETDRGLMVQGLVAAGYQVYAINPFAVSRYRDRHATSGAKSDPGDAKVLADLVRTDAHNHRPVAGDSELVEAIKIVARAHQTLIWSRQRSVNQLRSTLREFYPAALDAFGTDLAGRDAVALLDRAPTPQEGRTLSLSKIRATLERAGRQRNLDARATEIQQALRTPQLQPSLVLARAYGNTVRALVRILAQLNTEIAALEAELAETFEVHPDAEILRSLPGLGVVLGARALGEFGDDRTRYQDARARRCYAGMAPITRASGTRRVVLARVARNRRLADALYLWAFSSLTRSPGARHFYDAHRLRDNTHHQALRALANRLVGVLHGCLTHRTPYSEAVAWPAPVEAAA
jgi:transposase